MNFKACRLTEKGATVSVQKGQIFIEQNRKYVFEDKRITRNCLQKSNEVAELKKVSMSASISYDLKLVSSIGVHVKYTSFALSILYALTNSIKSGGLLSIIDSH